VQVPGRAQVQLMEQEYQQTCQVTQEQSKKERLKS
jgi:hypothetical protein